MSAQPTQLSLESSSQHVLSVTPYNTAILSGNSFSTISIVMTYGPISHGTHLWTSNVIKTKVGAEQSFNEWNSYPSTLGANFFSGKPVGHHGHLRPYHLCRMLAYTHAVYNKYIARLYSTELYGLCSIFSVRVCSLGWHDPFQHMVPFTLLRAPRAPIGHRNR